MRDIPAGRNGEQRDQTAENNKRCGETIGPQGPLQTDDRKPADSFNKLELTAHRIKMLAEHSQHQDEIHQQNADRHVAWHRRRGLVVARQQGHEQCRRRR